MSQDTSLLDGGGLAPIALGANLPGAAGAPEDAIRAALHALSQRFRVHSVSRFYRSPAWPPGSGPDFVNAAALVEPGESAGPDSARRLLDALHEVEAELGRARHARWAPRCIDVDLIGWGDLVLPDSETQARWRGLSPEAQQRETPDRLILPHPRLAERAFVLVPLAEIAPDWRDPVSGRRAADLLAALPPDDRAALVPLTTA